MPKPLYSVDLKPIFGRIGLPVYEGTVEGDNPDAYDLLKIRVSWSAYPDLDIAVGFTGSTGVGWFVPAGTAAEMAALYWSSNDNTSGGPESVYVIIPMLGGTGRVPATGVDGSGNPYYDVRIAAGWFTTDATGSYCMIDSWLGATHIGPYASGSLPNNLHGPATNHVVSIRVTPATSAIEFV